MNLRQTITASVFVHLAILGAFPHAAGCGAVATAGQREAYGAEVLRCVANEREIIYRQGTTAAEDAEALDMERARCDSALDAIYGGE